jgi:hypothetical protein
MKEMTSPREGLERPALVTLRDRRVKGEAEASGRKGLGCLEWAGGMGTGLGVPSGEGERLGDRFGPGKG